MVVDLFNKVLLEGKMQKYYKKSFIVPALKLKETYIIAESIEE